MRPIQITVNGKPWGSTIEIDGKPFEFATGFCITQRSVDTPPRLELDLVPLFRVSGEIVVRLTDDDAAALRTLLDSAEVKGTGSLARRALRALALWLLNLARGR